MLKMGKKKTNTYNKPTDRARDGKIVREGKGRNRDRDTRKEKGRKR